MNVKKILLSLILICGLTASRPTQATRILTEDDASKVIAFVSIFCFIPWLVFFGMEPDNTPQQSHED